MRMFLPLLPILLVTACDRKPDGGDGQPGIVANILDQAMPNAQQPAPAANAITPVEQMPDIPAPKPQVDGSAIVPAELLGRWTGVSDRCGDRMADLELNIMANSLVFHESVGSVKTVTPAPGGRFSIEAAFTGEGQSWTRTLDLRPSADGATLTIVNDGTAVVRKRC